MRKTTSEDGASGLQGSSHTYSSQTLKI